MGLIKTTVRLLLSLLLTGVAPGVSLAQTQASPAAAALIPGTRVRLLPPAGYTPAQDFPGYGREAQGSSIVVTELPGPYAELAAGLSNSAELKRRGMTLLGQEQVQVNGQKGLLLQIQQQAAGIDFLKWILLLGTEQESVLITATLPKELEGTLSEPLKASLLTTQWDNRQPIALTDGLNFSLGESGELKPAKRLANAVLYTKGGVFPTAAIEEPIFVVAPALSRQAIADPEIFAKKRVMATEGTVGVALQSQKKIKIDDLDGYEIIAWGEEADSGAPLLIYQVMLFEVDTYYLMQGLVGRQEGEGYLPDFRAIATSFKRMKRQ